MKFLESVLSLDILKGARSVIGGVGLIGTGVADIVMQMGGAHMPDHVYAIFTGIAVLGLKGKCQEIMAKKDNDAK